MKFKYKKSSFENDTIFVHYLVNKKIFVKRFYYIVYIFLIYCIIKLDISQW